MKKMKKCILLTVVCFAFVFLFSGCDSTSNANNINEVSMKDYYKIEDFQSIIIGESSLSDVSKIAPIQPLLVTSYGGYCEYPTENGRCIRIKFYGKDFIVGDIEEDSVHTYAD